MANGIRYILFEKAKWPRLEDCNEVCQEVGKTIPLWYQPTQRSFPDSHCYKVKYVTRKSHMYVTITSKEFPGVAVVVDHIPKFLGGFELSTSPSKVDSYLKEHGDQPIQSMSVCKVPLSKGLQKLANLVTLGKFNASKKRLNYADYFHLFLNVTLDNGVQCHVEKNQTINMGSGHHRPSGSTCTEVKITPSSQVTLNKLFSNALSKVGDHRLYVYDAVSANCQIFIKDLLSSSGLWSSHLESFVMQDVETATNWILRKSMKLATNLASNVGLIRQKIGLGLIE
jgi:hypothetical protein